MDGFNEDCKLITKIQKEGQQFYKPVQKIEQEQPSKSVEPVKLQQLDGKLEIEAEEKQLKTAEEFSIYWQEIRDDFQNVFQISQYNLEQPVPNPFGSQV